MTAVRAAAGTGLRSRPAGTSVSSRATADRGMLASMGSFLRGLSPRGKVTLAVLSAVIIALVAFFVGSAAGRPAYPGEGSPEVGFARDMAVHHAQAVELGMIAYQKASRDDVRAMAGDMALTQQNQIGRMQDWLLTWGVESNTTAAPMSWLPDGASMMRGNLMPGMATREEISALQNASGQQVDILFLQYMLRHHVGGIHMIDGLLELNPSAPVRDLATTMKANQQSEIDAMAKILAELGASPLPD